MSRGDAAAVMNERSGLRPRVGVVLGSGLGAVAEAVADPTTIDYGELPGFPVPGVAGHGGQAVLGNIGDVPVAVLQGRAHLYEGGDLDKIRTPIRALRAAGAEILVLTNAAGSLRPEVGPGSLMLISDHINLSGVNVLAGPNDDEIGPRFPSMRDAYDPELRAALRAAAEELGTTLAEGVYLAVSGPTFETPAEIRAFAHARRRRRGDVHRARDRGGAALRPARGGDLGDLEPRGGHERRAAQPRADPAATPSAPPRTSRRCWCASSRGWASDLRAGPDPDQARRRRAERRAAARAGQGHRRRQRERRPGGRAGDGDRAARHDPGRAHRADRRDAGLRRRARLVGRRPAGPRARQALHRRRGRQGEPPAGADRGRVRRRGADDLGARPRPHRRHARQARGDPGLRHDARPGRLPPGRGGSGRRDRGPDGAARTRRPPAVRDPRRHRHGRVDPADRGLDPLEEAGRGPRCARDGREGGLREPSCPTASRPRSSRARSWRWRTATACRPRRCSPTWTACSAAARATRWRCASRSTISPAPRRTSGCARSRSP